MEFRKPPEYFSQWGSLAANRCRIIEHGDPSGLVSWRAQGFRSAADYRFWSDSSCGVACVQSILHAAGREVPPKAQLIHELVDAGAYQVSDGSIAGLIYEPCVRRLRECWDIRGATFPSLTARELYSAITPSSLAVASVAKDIRTPGSRPPQRGGHLVLVFGAEDGCFTFHNPSGLAREDAEDGVESASGAVLPVERFEWFFASRAMIFSA